jgi:hypothetical protein
MRHLLVLPSLLVAFGLATPCVAQSYATAPGVFLVGGTARITHFRDIGNNASTFVMDLNPRIGYFVAPGLAFSANLQFAHYSEDLGSSSQYGVGPGLIYYFRHHRTRLNPYLSARTLYVRQTVHPDSGPSSTTETFSWLASLGGALFVARNVALTAEAFYSHDHVSTDLSGSPQANNAEEYGTQFGVSVYLY